MGAVPTINTTLGAGEGLDVVVAMVVSPIDRRLTGLAGPDYDATISFGLPIEPEDSQYGEPGFTGGPWL